MSLRFKTRGYQHKTVFRAYNKAKCLPREQLLVHKQKDQLDSDQVYFATQYSNQANKIKQIVKRNWDILKSDSVLREALPDASTISFRRAPTLNDKLVKSHLPPVQQKTWLTTRRGNHKCRQCNPCSNMINANYFTIISGRKYNLIHL